MAKFLPKILIIEDEKLLAKMYQEKISKAGFKVFVAFGAKRGLKLVKKERPEMVLLDILLPEENGIFFLEKLRKSEKISTKGGSEAEALLPPKVLVFSNYDDPETKKKALKLGAVDYLIKTAYTPREMVEKIKSYLK